MQHVLTGSYICHRLDCKKKAPEIKAVGHSLRYKKRNKGHRELIKRENDLKFKYKAKTKVNRLVFGWQTTIQEQGIGWLLLLNLYKKKKLHLITERPYPQSCMNKWKRTLPAIIDGELGVCRLRDAEKGAHGDSCNDSLQASLEKPPGVAMMKHLANPRVRHFPHHWT